MRVSIAGILIGINPDLLVSNCENFKSVQKRNVNPSEYGIAMRGISIIMN